MIVLLFGPPGCGKGVQAAFIARRFGIPGSSTANVPVGMQGRDGDGRLTWSILSRGGLVGDDVVNRILARRISLPEFTSGFLLDGYPRTLPQGQFLDRMLKQRGSNPVVSIHLDVPFPMIVKRITSRRQCPQCLHIYNLVSRPAAGSRRVRCGWNSSHYTGR